MATYENHKALLMQSIRKLKLSIIEGIELNSRDIAFNASAGSIDLLSILLHKLGKIDTGFIIKHEWFKKPQLGQKKQAIYEERIKTEFPEKQAIYGLMCSIEELRNKIAYNITSKETIQSMLDYFFKLKELTEKITGEAYD